MEIALGVRLGMDRKHIGPHAAHVAESSTLMGNCVLNTHLIDLAIASEACAIAHASNHRPVQHQRNRSSNLLISPLQQAQKISEGIQPA